MYSVDVILMITVLHFYTTKRTQHALLLVGNVWEWLPLLQLSIYPQVNGFLVAMHCPCIHQSSLPCEPQLRKDKAKTNRDVQ